MEKMPKRKKAKGKGNITFFAVLLAAAALVSHFTGVFTLSDLKEVIGVSTSNISEGEVQVH